MGCAPRRILCRGTHPGKLPSRPCSPGCIVSIPSPARILSPFTTAPHQGAIMNWLTLHMRRQACCQRVDRWGKWSVEAQCIPQVLMVRVGAHSLGAGLCNREDSNGCSGAPPHPLLASVASPATAPSPDRGCCPPHRWEESVGCPGILQRHRQHFKKAAGAGRACS